ncbi:hypothetical protein [Cupriavidus alkaliphilus]|uniref:hypothetical protein n=1 Tax=Cupriavidus alkaliphilus TaxID=942866 RepID=UPI0010579B77|nr:hypothetical protein [Cupriavidus alkaliphilus]
MTPSEASAIVAAMRDSLRENPEQFKIELSVIGQQVTTNGGGTGVSVSVSGFGSGTTIGQQIGVSGGQIQIASKRGSEAMDLATKHLISTLDQLVTELRSPKPNVKTLSDKLKSIGSWVPPVIQSVLASVLSAAIEQL